MNKQPIRKGIATAVIAGMTLVGAGINAQTADAAALNTNSAAKVNNFSFQNVSGHYGFDWDSLLKQFPELQNMLNEAQKAAQGQIQGPGQGQGQETAAPKPVDKPAPVQKPVAKPAPANGGAPESGNKAPAAEKPADSVKSSFAEEVVKLVNQERAKQGLKPLTSDPLLTKVALAKAKDMYDNNYFDHNSPTYGSPFDMMRKFGVTYTYAGENIAKGQPTPQKVMTDWMNSPGHRANILKAEFNKIGVAYYNGEWVQEFTS